MLLRNSFDDLVRSIWSEWDRRGCSGTPFEDLDEENPLWDNAGMNYDVGFVTGVSAALGWSLDRPEIKV